MLRKFYLAIAGAATLVAIMGLSTQALANHVAFQKHDPDCDGPTAKYPNTSDIHEFKLDTRTKLQYAPGAVRGGALACGSTLKTFDLTSDLTLYQRADVKVPKGVIINQTSTGIQGRFVGRATINVLARVAGSAQFFGNQLAKITVDHNAAGCQSLVPAGSTLEACYFATSTLGDAHTATYTDNVTKRYTFTIGPITPAVGNGATGLTRFTVNLCQNYGQPLSGPLDPGSCGTSIDPVIQKNGKAPSPNCALQPKELGTYKATATQLGGTVTPEVKTCVDWVPFKSIP